MHIATEDRSYGALFRVPSIGRILFGMQIARISQSMVSVTMVLFALATYGSSTIAGLAAFFIMFPGLMVSPIAGALLDRHGRTRLVALDYVIALVTLVLIGALSLAHALPAALLIAIAGVASLTTPLSGTGVRSLFPLIVPTHLWERVNAIDSTGYVMATIIGPPLAALMFAAWGGAVAFIVIGLSFAVAAVIIAGAPDPTPQTETRLPLLTEAWEGLIYTWRNPTLRGLGFCISVLNLNTGVYNIVVPLIVLRWLQLDARIVGLVFAVQGVAGIVSAVFFGRHDTRSRERMMLAVPMFATGAAIAILLLKSNLVAIVLVMLITGFLNGPVDIALFTVRQRRTDKNWTGRAFAVSMSFNALGLPIGSALAGVVAARSIPTAIGFGVAMSVIAGVIAARMVPATD
jgi:MFS family permease